MAKKRAGRYTDEFKQMCVARMKQCDNIGALAKELELHRRMLYRWRDQLDPVEKSAGLSPPPSRKGRLRQQVAQLKRALADKTLEVDFFKGACKKSRLDASSKTSLARRHLRPNPEVMSLQGKRSIERMCQLAQVSRAGFNRSLQQQQPLQEEMEVRSTIQQIVLQHRRRSGCLERDTRSPADNRSDVRI